MKLRTAGLALVLSAAGAAYAVDDAAFARCRGIADAAARLRCYDGLPMPVAPSVAQPPPVAPSRPAAPVAAAPAAAPAPAPAPAFGMEEKQAQKLPTTMESTIPGHFGGWGPGARIKLANGQVWQVVDGTSAWFNVENPKIVIRRGMMGGFFLEVENSNRSPRVKRIQ